MTEQDAYEQACFEKDLHDGYVASLNALPPIDPETRRRVLELCSYRCPDHGCDLEECEDVDETGVHVYYRCPVGDHVFGSAHNHAGGYFPCDDEIGVLAIDVDPELRR